MKTAIEYLAEATERTTGELHDAMDNEIRLPLHVEDVCNAMESYASDKVKERFNPENPELITSEWLDSIIPATSDSKTRWFSWDYKGAVLDIEILSRNRFIVSIREKPCDKPREYEASKIVSYRHQLQNLFQCLTGREIT